MCRQEEICGLVGSLHHSPPDAPTPPYSTELEATPVSPAAVVDHFVQFLNDVLVQSVCVCVWVGCWGCGGMLWLPRLHDAWLRETCRTRYDAKSVPTILQASPWCAQCPGSSSEQLGMPFQPYPPTTVPFRSARFRPSTHPCPAAPHPFIHRSQNSLRAATMFVASNPPASLPSGPEEISGLGCPCRVASAFLPPPSPHSG